MFINKSNIHFAKTHINNKMNSYKNKSIKIIIQSFFIILIDQFSKLLILKTLGYENSKSFIPKLVNITLVKNKGAAFSLFSNSTTILTLISILASIILISIIVKSPPISYWNSNGLAFLLGGTLGNGIDRLFKGYVLDFINLVPINFPIFNVADISINIALICFILGIIKTSKNNY